MPRPWDIWHDGRAAIVAAGTIDGETYNLALEAA